MCLPLQHLDTHRLASGVHLGYEWEVVHNGMAYRCGYVRVEKGHPWFEQEPDVEVHGGLTFSAHGKACPTHGEQNEWWIGFDCAHCWDAPDPALPGYRDRGYSFGEETLRTTEYVIEQCRQLAEQAHAAATKVS